MSKTIKPLIGALIIILIFGGIFYYSVQNSRKAYYESRIAESYNGVVEKKEIYKKGAIKEGCIIFFADKTSISNDYNLYNHIEVGDSLSKLSNSPTVEIYSMGKLKTFTFLKPVLFRKKNFLVEDGNK